jgi:hypothetical protein
MSEPTSMPPDANAEPPAQPGMRRGVLCIKCEKLNEPGTERCVRCETHLYVTCTHCETKNARVNSRCTRCKHRLHKRRGLGGNPAREVNYFYVGLVLAGLVVAIGLLLWLAGARLPRLW